MPLVLELLLVFCASSATDYVRQKDFTLKERGERVELEVRMTPTLSHYNECPLLYNMFTSFWARAAAHPRRSHLLHDLITQVFLRSLQYGIVVMGFIDAFVYAHHQHRRSIEHPGNFGEYDGHHSCLRPRISGNMPNKTHACNPASELPLAEAQSQVSASPQRSYPQHAKEAMISSDGPSVLMEVLALLMVKL